MALRRNILLFHQGALGDFVLTWPVAVALARIHPQSRVFYVTQAQKGRLAERALGVEWADADAGWYALFGDGTNLPDLPGRLLAGAHSVLSFFSAPDGPWAANVRRLALEANVLAIDPNPPDDFPGHATDHQLGQLRPWPAAHAAVEQILRSVRARGVSVARAAPAGDGGGGGTGNGGGGGAGAILIHPGSGSPAKNWPLGRFLDLIRRLRAGGHAVRVLLGEVEQERWPAEAHQAIGALAPIERPQTYSDLLSVLVGARAFVGNDSGPGHLAAIIGVPTLSLFGPTDPARWAPLGPRTAAVRSQPIDALEVDAVLEKLQPLLG